MCGRFFLTHDVVFGGLTLSVTDGSKTGSAESSWTAGDIRPMDHAIVVANNRNRQPSLFSMRWGYQTDKGQLIINARAETAAEKALFIDGINNRRCAIPFSGYYEWRQVGRERLKYAISAEGEAQTFLAGIYRFEKQQPVFVVLTCEPSASVKHIHNRMPVILTKAAAEKWLQFSENASCIVNQACGRLSPQLIEGTEPIFDFLSEADMAGFRDRLEE